MDMIEAMEARHMVRKYSETVLTESIINALNARVEENNTEHGLAIKLMINDKNAIGIIAKMILAKGVNNYFILAGDDSPGLEEKLGYSGADLMLYAQTLGLNTWYVGGMFNRNVAQFVDGKKVVGVIAVGYGQTEGIPHKSKLPADVSRYTGDVPEWFVAGINASLLAPTALNRQDYMITGTENRVRIENENGIFTGANRGLIKYHFELGAGKENFLWES